MAFADARAGGYVKNIGPMFYATVKTGNTIKAGDPINLTDADGVVLALATVGTALQGDAVAVNDAVAGAQVCYCTEGILGGRLSGMTVGGKLYVEEGADAGYWTETEPTTTGDCNTPLGVSISATEVHFKTHPGEAGYSTHA